MSATTTSQSLATLLFFFLTSIVQAYELDELAPPPTPTGPSPALPRPHRRRAVRSQ